MSKTTITIAALGVLALAGCRSDREQTSDSDYRGTSTSQTGGMQGSGRDTGRVEASAGRDGRLSAEDRNFVTQAASSGRFEVESSQLALQKTQDAEHRQFAQKMIDDHTRANRELESLASRKGISLDASMASRHATMLDRLRGLNANEFDREFHQVQIEAHREAIQLFERASRESSDGDLRAFAQRTLPTLRAHLSHMQEMTPSNVR